MNLPKPRSIALSLLALVGALLMSAALAQQADAAFTAEFQAVNPQLTTNDVSGQAILTIAGDDLRITLIAKGMPAGMRLAHIHGFITEQASSCPAADADVNGDGIVDLIETEPSAGVTLIPFNADPAGLKILSDSYPISSADGLVIYQATLSLAALNDAIAAEYDIANLNLADRVIFIHGVADEVMLPDTVQSLPNVPARVTVPIACGKLNVF